MRNIVYDEAEKLVIELGQKLKARRKSLKIGLEKINSISKPTVEGIESAGTNYRIESFIAYALELGMDLSLLEVGEAPKEITAKDRDTMRQFCRLSEENKELIRNMIIALLK